MKISINFLSVFAVSQGAFHGLFSNLDDVAGYVQTPNEKVTCNGTTMELSRYLADDSGIAMELMITRDDSLPFAPDILGIGCLDELSFWVFGEASDEVILTRRSPQVTINDRMH